MFDFLYNYGGTLAVGLILAVIVGIIVVRLWRNHKKGRLSCGCGCNGCTHACCCGPGSVKTTPKQENRQ